MSESIQSLLPNAFEFAAIVVMAVTTYFTRIIGFLYLKKRQLSERTLAVLQASPCCVMVSIFAPHFLTKDPATLFVLVCTVLMAFKLNLALTILLSVVLLSLLYSI